MSPTNEPKDVEGELRHQIYKEAYKYVTSAEHADYLTTAVMQLFQSAQARNRQATLQEVREGLPRLANCKKQCGPHEAHDDVIRRMEALLTRLENGEKDNG
jgi:hypothetical protein